MIISTTSAAICDVPKPASLDHTAIVWHEHFAGQVIIRVHSSGAHGSKHAAPATVSEVVAYTVALIDQYRPHVLTTTESTQHGLVAALRTALGKQYAVRKAGEYLCIVDRTVARHRVARPKLIRLTDIKGLHDDWRNLFIGAFGVKILAASDVAYLVTVGHVASGVQAGARYTSDPKRQAMVASSREGLRAWGAWLDQQPSATVCSAAMDSNLDHHRAVWRRRVADDMGGPTIWDRRQPIRGSHGARLIDSAVCRFGGSTVTAPASPSNDLVILHAACHGPTLTWRRIRQACRRYGADSIGWTEAYRRNRFMRLRPRFKMVVGKSTTDIRRGAKDNPILVRRRHKVIDAGAIKGCDASTPMKIAPERWTTFAVYEHPLGRILHVALHPNAGVDNAWTSDRAAKYREQMQGLLDLIEAKKAELEIDHVVVTGDLNYRRRDPARKLSPRWVFAKLGLSYRVEGLDWIAWSDGLLLVHWRVIPTSENGQDHPWLLIHLARKEKP